MHVTWKSPAARPARGTRASGMSLTKPKRRLTSVKPPIVPTFRTRLLMARTCSPAPDGPGAGSGLADRRRNALGVALLRLDLLHEQAVEINRFEKQRRETAVAPGVGDDAASEGEKDARRCGQGGGLKAVLGDRGDTAGRLDGEAG